MKITKKFKGMLSLAFTAMLTVGSVTANATTPNEGTVLPEPKRKGSITIHKYEIGSMSNAGAPATGLNNKDQVPAGSIPLNGIDFKVQSLTEYDSKQHGPISENDTITFQDKEYQVVTNDGIVYFIDKRYNLKKIDSLTEEECNLLRDFINITLQTYAELADKNPSFNFDIIKQIGGKKTRG